VLQTAITSVLLYIVQFTPTWINN